MKRGELIILWVAGIWTIVAIVLGGDPHVSGGRGDAPLYQSAAYLSYVFRIAAPMWILCGLAWVTIYKRTKK
ncbi:MAG: hypothetical protein ACREQA_19040 [Candidatus Binatia bacterium]